MNKRLKELKKFLFKLFKVKRKAKKTLVDFAAEETKIEIYG